MRYLYLCAAVVFASSAADAALVGVQPTFIARYVQTGPATVTPNASIFAADAFADSAADFDGGTVLYPNGVSRPLTPRA